MIAQKETGKGAPARLIVEDKDDAAGAHACPVDIRESARAKGVKNDPHSHASCRCAGECSDELVRDRPGFDQIELREHARKKLTPIADQDKAITSAHACAKLPIHVLSTSVPPLAQ